MAQNWKSVELAESNNFNKLAIAKNNNELFTFKDVETTQDKFFVSVPEIAKGSGKIITVSGGCEEIQLTRPKGEF